jgi:hypothetical protein
MKRGCIDEKHHHIEAHGERESPDPFHGIGGIRVVRMTKSQRERATALKNAGRAVQTGGFCHGDD